MPDQHQGILAAVVGAQAASAPDQGWLEAARDDRVVTRAELADVVAHWRPLGLAGHRVALLTADPVAFGVLFVALVSAGSTVVPLDAAAPPDAVAQLVAASRATMLVTTADRPPPVGVERVVHASPTTLRPQAPPTGGPLPPAGPADGACVLFSSGSTGPRKAIRLSEAQLLHVARAVAAAHELGPEDRGLNSLALHHVNGEVVGLLAPLVSGGTVVLDARFRRTGFWDLVRARSATWVNAVPSIVTILANEPPEPAGPTAPSSLRFVRSASAPLAATVLARFEERYGVPVVESYGMTEAASQITVNPLDGRRPGTVGRPVGVELRVVDEARHDVRAGQVGHVLIRGRGVIRAYEGGVGADRFDADGWLDTGDLGARDPDGYLTLAGRDGEAINRGGEKVFPREVEEVLSGHPSVSEAVVVGRADAVLGEVPVAYVVPGAEAPPDLEDQLADRCAGLLARERRPVEIRLVPEVPHGPTGKPVRRLVAEQDAAREREPQAAGATVS